jgi:chromosome segregation ATPase
MICKMVKKGVIGAGLGALALGLIFGTAAPSYVKTAFHKARHGVKASVPVEFEIDRARQEIAALEPAILGGIETLARAQTEVDQLNREIASAREELNKEGHALQALNTHLKTGDLHLTGGVAYSERELKSDMARRMDHYNVLKGTLSQKQNTLVLLQKNVTSAKEGLEALRVAKQDLTARVEGAEARLNQIKAARAAHRYTFDDSAIGQAKRTVSDLEKKLEQMARVDELTEKYMEDGVTVTPDPTRDVSREIEAEFGSAPKAEKF